MKSAAGENRKPTQWAPRVAQGKSAQPWVCCGENRKPTQWATACSPGQVRAALGLLR
jgi:hypothetical protein